MSAPNSSATVQVVPPSSARRPRDGEGDQDAGDGEREDAAPVGERCVRLEVEAGLEQQDRQEDVEDEVRREADRSSNVRDQAEGEADQHQTDGVGHADAPRDDGHRGGDDQEQDEGLLDRGGPPPSEARSVMAVPLRRRTGSPAVARPYAARSGRCRPWRS